jgi:uncharacterized protein YbjQ (UPF0145 family)
MRLAEPPFAGAVVGPADARISPIIVGMTDQDDRPLVQAPRQPYPIAPREGVRPEMVTTTFTLDGYRVVNNVGVVRGLVVRSRSVVGNLGATLQMLFGGNISIFTSMCERARQDAFLVMLQHAAELGANAVVGMRYDATEIMGGVTEVLAYGTAVQVEPAG